MTNQRTYIRGIANSIRDPELRAQRIFFAEPTFALTGLGDVEFDIKHRISDHFRCDFRSVAFCGSAHLGFSPTKDSEFSPGASDLDVAIIDNVVFQDVWRDLVALSQGFNNLSVFGSEPEASEKIAELRDMLSKRGLIHSHNLPRGEPFDKDRAFFQILSRAYTRLFSGISVSFYMNEYAFAWKQNASIQQILRM